MGKKGRQKLGRVELKLQNYSVYVEAVPALAVLGIKQQHQHCKPQESSFFARKNFRV